jgi:T-lymphoma invasion and metastasis-inducing protein 1
MKSSTDDMIDSLVCPPPPSDNAINEDIISSLIVPAPGYSKFQWNHLIKAII